MMISLASLQAFLGRALSAALHLRSLSTVCALGAFYALWSGARFLRQRSRTTALRGPPNPSFVWGVGKATLSPNAGDAYERWADEYGGVYEIPFALGSKKIVLCDPKAVAHMFGGEASTYTPSPFAKASTEFIVGKSILTEIGENHRRQRKVLTPAFSNTAIRNLASVFYESAYKTKSHWESLIEANGGGGTVIEVQHWMNCISLDSVGIGGFSHDFGSLDGKPSSVTEVFDALAKGGEDLVHMLLVIGHVFPWLLKIPTPRSNLLTKLNDTVDDISNALLAKSRKEKETGVLEESEEKSILGLLIRAETVSGQLRLTREEVVALAKVLLIAGYETTSKRTLAIQWALIRLSKNPDVQTKLRTELLEFGPDPTYDQFSNRLPYLDAVVHETLRMHPPLTDFNRVALVDDVIPLSKPVRTRSGKLVDHISVAEGTCVYVSAPAVNCSTELWGPDAKEFRPERWINEEGIPAGAKEVQGHRHLLTFLDGPRTCLGKGFALAQIKIVLSVLVKNFVLELRDGPRTEIGTTRGLLPRPKVAGERGAVFPLCVRRLE